MFPTLIKHKGNMKTQLCFQVLSRLPFWGSHPSLKRKHIIQAARLGAGDLGSSPSKKIPWRKKWQPTPLSVLKKSHGQKKPGGLQSMGSERLGHDLATKQQQQWQWQQPHPSPTLPFSCVTEPLHHLHCLLCFKYSEVSLWSFKIISICFYSHILVFLRFCLSHSSSHPNLPFLR